MKRFLFSLAIVILLLTPAFAQEKVVNNTSVTFSVLSWEDIQKGLKDKPADHSLDFHLKLARAMLETHGGGSKGAQHVMVLLTDVTFGYQISNAEVQVTAISKTGSEEVSRQLKLMSIDGLPGYGEYFKLASQGPFVFKVKITLGKNKIHEAEFEKTIAGMGGQGGAMMGGQGGQQEHMEQSSMMMHKEMMGNMMNMTNQMSEIMGNMSGMMRNMTTDNMKNMSKVMNDMSIHVMGMSRIMSRGIASEEEMKQMQDEMMQVQQRLSDMKK